MERINSPRLRLVRDTLASYVRPFTRDYGRIGRLIAEGHSIGCGVILDPRALDRSDDLRKMAADEKLEVILDPLSVELSTAGGLERTGMSALPWAPATPHRPEDFTSVMVERVARDLARTVVSNGFSAVLAPSHFLDSVPSGWIATDLELARALRAALDGLGATRTPIYYPLVVRLRTVQSPTIRDYLMQQLAAGVEAGSIDAIWLRVPGFGAATSGPINLRRYIEFARAVHGLGVPIVGERTGTIGVALLAFSAVGGIEQGVTFGERYDLAPITGRQKGARPYLPAPRVYIPEIGLFLQTERASELLRHRTVRNRFACQRRCCKRGIDDMIGDPRRHFLVSRADEVRELSLLPREDRAEQYLETWLRPATDRATAAARVDPSLTTHRERLDQWRATLGEIRDRDRFRPPSVSAIPSGVRIQLLGA